jgi:RND family efflux transporter MFP subunit
MTRLTSSRTHAAAVRPGGQYVDQLLYFVAAFSLCLAASGCGSATSMQAVEGGRQAKETQIAAVGVVKPKLEALSREVILNGEFRPYQVADLHAKVAGYLRKITVDVGSHVKAGQEIATLEMPEMEADLAVSAAERQRREAEVRRASADVERAQAQKDLAQVSLDRLIAAAKAEPGIIAQQEIDEARARMRAAEAQVNSAKASGEVEERQVGAARAVEQRAAAMWRYRTIQAPFDGIVTKRFADQGAMIQAGTASQTQAMPVIRVAEIQRLRLAVSVPESFVPLVRNGTAVQIRVGALNRSFGGTVARLTRDVASNSRTMEAEIDVSNGDLRLTPGMFADVVLKLEKRERGLTIPITTVNNSGGNRSVLVVSKNGQIEERGITTGIESAATLEILSGLGEEDLVVVSNRSLLKAGQRVEAKLVAEN